MKPPFTLDLLAAGLGWDGERGFRWVVMPICEYRTGLVGKGEEGHDISCPYRRKRQQGCRTPKRNVSKGATKSVIEMSTGGGGRLVRGERTLES
jgi:hypothetical protein